MKMGTCYKFLLILCKTAQLFSLKLSREKVQIVLEKETSNLYLNPLNENRKKEEIFK